MKSFVAILALVAIAAADVSHIVSPEATATVIEQAVQVDPEQFSARWLTSNGISGQESGVLKSFGKEKNAIVVTGSSSYTAPDGSQINLEYVADENGYQPRGSHLPTPPPPQPIPDYILRSIAYNAANPSKSEDTPRRI